MEGAEATTAEGAEGAAETSSDTKTTGEEKPKDSDKKEESKASGEKK